MVRGDAGREGLGACNYKIMRCFLCENRDCAHPRNASPPSTQTGVALRSRRLFRCINTHITKQTTLCDSINRTESLHLCLDRNAPAVPQGRRIRTSDPSPTGAAMLCVTVCARHLRARCNTYLARTLSCTSTVSLSLSQKPSSPHQRRTVPPTRELGKREGGGHAQSGRHRPSSLSLSRLSRRPISRPLPLLPHESAEKARKTRERHTRLPSSSARPKSSLSVCCLPNRSRSIPNSKKKNQEESLAARCRTLRQTSLKKGS